MPREDRTVRESVQPLPKNQAINQQLAVAGVAENINVTGMEEWRKITIVTDLAVYIAFDIGIAVAPTAANGLELGPGESYSDEGVRVTRLRFINVVGGQQPRLRGIMWGM